MLSFTKKFFAAPSTPIGVDLGTDTLRLAQCVHDGREWQLAAAACTDVPASARESTEALNTFAAEAIRDLVAGGNFSGRSAVFSVPSSQLQIQHVRMPKLDESETRKALPWELKGKLSVDPAQAVLRYVIAGETQVGGEAKNEVVVMATPKTAVDNLIALAARARLQIVGLNTEPKAIVDCFAHVYRRKVDGDVTSLFVDIGAKRTRVTIASGSRILFARSIDIGGDTLSAAVAEAMGLDFEQAKLLRVKLAHQPLQRPAPAIIAPEPAAPVAEENAFALLGLARVDDRRRAAERVEIVAPVLPTGQDEQDRQAEAAVAPVIARLCDELNLCRRYHEATFTQQPVDRVIFVGGEARQRPMCQRIAQELGVAAQLGDPLVRMSKTTLIGVESGIDLSQPQPSWAVAVGLSMGPLAEAAVLAA
ncbi:MAG TPA: pilus assembly protein PilM [Tepidisphaeraceae bacterium]|jgi:type IV pilus assembly protein PilM